MPMFAPVYSQPKAQQSYLTRQQRLESRKRKRGDSNDDDDDGDASQSSADSDPSRTQRRASFHPVNNRDPYHVAGHSREEALPLPPFPHAAIKESSSKKVPIDDELAALNLPLYIPPTQAEDQSTSLKRRHLDNVTTILHRCMLKGDWPRAARAWSLLLRTEIAGRGIDVRRNGRWGIGAEILMRGGTKQVNNRRDDSNDGGGDSTSEHHAQEVNQPQFTDEGFRLAREYYERLILQYPHTARSQHHLNATAIYPALFNVWIYEVQDRARQAKKGLNISDSDSAGNVDDSMQSDTSNPENKAALRHVQAKELEQALPIATRMDELLLSPPYDTSSTLLQLRGMAAMWISDLHAQLATSAESDGMNSDRSSIAGMSDPDWHQDQSRASLRKAKELFTRLNSTGAELPQQVLDILDEDNE